MSENASRRYAALDLDKSLFGASLLPHVMDYARRETRTTMLRTISEDRVADELRHLPDFLRDRRADTFDGAMSAIPGLVRSNIFPFVGPLIDSLHRADLEVVLVTQSPTEWARVAAKAIGNVDRVLGSTLHEHHGRFTGDVSALDKTLAMGHLTDLGYAAHPDFAAGDTPSDLPMLTSAIEHGGKALAICLADNAELGSHVLHAAIHRDDLPIPIIGYDALSPLSDQVLHCEGSLLPPELQKDGLACEIGTISLSELLALSGS